VFNVGPAQQTGGPGAHRLTIQCDNLANLEIRDTGTAGLNKIASGNTTG
jgi:hypothetical protein